jgi:molybdopterin-guanine dinucleotide biosynthesis protein A
MSSPETLVVILAGGYSSRMGKPKALLAYSGKPQYLNLLDLATELKMPAVISCREEQMHEFSEVNLLPDDAEFQGHGPISGLLSSHKQFPQSDILLLGCDYPLLTAKHLQSLLSPHYSHTSAVCWKKKNAPKPEPMPALYKVEALKEIKKRFEQGRYSLSEYLTGNGVHLIEATSNADFLRSIDNPEDYRNIVDNLNN